MRNAVCFAPLYCDGCSVDRLLDDESILRVRHCSVSDCFFEISYPCPHCAVVHVLILQICFSAPKFIYLFGSLL